MIVAVTGASGHIGGNLVRALLKRGDTVKALVHGDTRAMEGLDVTRVPGDVLDTKSIDELVEGAELVYHLAAIITIVPDRNGTVYRVNVGGPRNVATACLKARVRRLVHFSSIHAFAAEPKNQVVDENRPLASGPYLFSYDRSKSDGQRAVIEAIGKGLDAVMVHPTGVMGPYDYKPSELGSVLLDLYHRKMPALVKGGFNWVDVRDICAGAIAAAERGRTGEKYLLAGHYLPVPDLGALVEEITGVPRPRFIAPLWSAHLGIPFEAISSKFTGKSPKFTRASLHALCNHQQISHAKAARELGYNPRPLVDTIRDTFDWFREAGRLSKAS